MTSLPAETVVAHDAQMSVQCDVDFLKEIGLLSPTGSETDLGGLRYLNTESENAVL